MPALTRLALLGAGTLVLIVLGGPGCKKKATQPQCDELLDRFAELVVKERFPDAGAAEVEKERARERNEAKADQAFKNCTSEVQAAEHACAMKAATSEALIKCLD
jgi:hypothetical protein